MVSASKSCWPSRIGWALVVFGAAPAAATAMLPLDAPGLLPQAREVLDVGLRDALIATDVDLALQPLDRTMRLIGEAVGSGLDCSLTEEACALRAGLAAEVDRVIVARIERVAGRLLLYMVLLDEGGAPPRRVVAVVEPPEKDGGASLRAAALRLLRGEGAPTPMPVLLEVAPKGAVVVVDERPSAAGVLWLTPGTHHLRVTSADGELAPYEGELVVAPDVRAADVTITLQARVADAAAEGGPAAGGSSLVLAGIGVAGVGALLTVGGTVAAVVVEILLGEKMTFNERETLRTFGAGCLLVIPIGIGAVGVGAALSFVGASE